MGTGTLEIVSDTKEKIDGLRKIMDHYTNQTQWEFSEKVVDRTKVLKLSVRTWSCKEH